MRGYRKDASPFTEDVHPSVVTSADFQVRGHLTRICTALASSCTCTAFYLFLNLDQVTILQWTL